MKYGVWGASAARHEAGHWIVAKMLEFTPTGIERQCDAGLVRLNTARRLRTLDDVRIFLEQRVQILFAGCIAEHMGQDGAYERAAAIELFFREKRYEDDVAKVLELGAILLNIQCVEASDSLRRAVLMKEWDKTYSNLLGRIEALNAISVAATLLTEGSVLSTEDILDLPDVHLAFPE